jgi:hypothetical protein
MPISEPIARENRVIFSRGEREFTAKEVVDCAVLRGEIDSLWDEFVRIGECDRLASEQELEPDESAVDAAAIAFRYHHDLDHGGGNGTVARRIAECRWASSVNILPANIGAARIAAQRKYRPPPYQTAAAEEKDLFLVDLILSGSLDQMAERLSYRIAAQADENSEEGAKEERGRFLTARRITDLAAWLAQFGRDEEWLNQMLAAEASYRQACRTHSDGAGAAKGTGAAATEPYAF